MSEKANNLDETVEMYSTKYDDVLLLSAGDDLTEDLVGYITKELSDEELDQIDVHRELDRRDDLASEPITIACLIGASSAVAVAVGRIVERWLETKRQEEQINLTMTAYKESPEAGKAVAGIVRTHAGVASPHCS